MAGEVDALRARVAVWEAKEAMRATLMRYLDLCDVPGPLTSPHDLGELFTPRAVWEGIGPEYAATFGRVTGRKKIAEKVAAYLPPNEHFERNAHLAGSEQLTVTGARGQGQWLMQQLSHYTEPDQPSEAICARLTVDFDLDRTPAEDTGPSCTALIRHFRTQRLFAAPLAAAVTADTDRPKE